MLPDMKGMFNSCHKLKEIKGINNFDTSKVINMRGIFCECNELEYLDLSSSNTSNATDMGYMFNNCNKLKSSKRKKGIINFNNMNIKLKDCNEFECFDLSNFNTSNVTDIDFMFAGCKKLKQIKGINKFNTIKVINMKGMFGGCQEIEYLDLSNFNTSNVLDMSAMFIECHNLKQIKRINKFITIKVASIYAMFHQYKELEYLDLSSFDTSNVTDMGLTFALCYKLKEIKGINNFKTNSVKNMFGMFCDCRELEYLDLSNFNTSNSTNMGFMFYGCKKLKEIKGINNFKTNNVNNMRALF